MVRRVGGVELGAPCERPDDARDEMVVGAATRETDQVLSGPIATSEGCEVGQDLLLRYPRGKIQGSLQAEVLGDLREEVVDRRNADRREHLANVVVGVGCEPHTTSVRAVAPVAVLQPEASSSPYLVTNER